MFIDISLLQILQKGVTCGYYDRQCAMLGELKLITWRIHLNGFIPGFNEYSTHATL